MQTLQTVLPIIIYFLLIVLLIFGIVLLIKCIKIVDKTKLIMDNVEKKINSLNGVFQIVDTIGSRVSSLTNKAFGLADSFLGKILKNKRKKTREEEELEEILEKERNE